MSIRRSFIALLIWVIICYVLPVQALLRPAFEPIAFALPTFRLAGLPDPMIMEINPAYAGALLLGYLLVLALATIVVRLLRAYHSDAALAWLATLTSIKDLKGLDDLLLQLLPLAALGFTLALPFWHTESTVVLLTVAWLALMALRVGRTPQVVPAVEPQPVRPLPKPEVRDGDVVKKFTWHFPERISIQRGVPSAEFTVELPICRARYEEFRSRPRELNPEHWGSYVVAEIPEVDALAGKLHALGRERGYRSYEQASNALAFTQQCIQYAHDLSPETGELIEYPKYPVETLMEALGDCEDDAILTAALLKRMGYDVALIIGPGHAAVGIAGAQGLPGTFVDDSATGTKYFYAEATADGWLPGETPSDIKALVCDGRLRIVRAVASVFQ